MPQEFNQYRKKPIVVEAVQFDGTKACADFLKEQGADIGFLAEDFVLERYDKVFIGTLEGNMKANKGDWIIKGIKGEFYPVKDDIFKMTYECVKEEGK